MTMIAESVKPDAKKRVVLPKAPAGITYQVFQNRLGQIILDPQVSIPASEAWLFEDKDALAAVDRGMAESNAGQLIDRGSFAPHARDAT
jgi:hypothetical protein